MSFDPHDQNTAGVPAPSAPPAQASPYAPPNPYGPPQTGALVRNAADALTTEIGALKLGGTFLLAGAVVNIAAMAIVGETIVQATYSRGFMAILFDLYIGGSLAFGRFSVRGWAIIRAALGAVLGLVAIAGGDHIGGALTIAFCSAILLLVAPGGALKARRGISIALFGLVMAAAVLVLALGRRG